MVQGPNKRSRQRLRGVFLVTALALLVTSPALGQRLSGRLLDLSTERPIVSGLLTLLTPDSGLVSTAMTDRDGSWVLRIPGPGTYFVEAKRLGYQPWMAGPVELSPGDDFTSVFHLKRLPVRLDAIEVSGTATERYLSLTGFYDRQRSDFGHFMTPEDIERRRAATVSDLMQGLPGVNVVSMTTGSVGARYIQLRGSNLSQGGVCRPRIFVDGLMFARGDAVSRRIDPDPNTETIQETMQRIDQGMSIDDIGHPGTIAAIEISRSASQVPVQFGGTSTETQCGVIVVWTRTGRMAQNIR